MPTNLPKITVLIPTYKRPQYLTETIDSILAQTIPPLQIILVNNGSDPDTRKLCEHYKGKIDYLEYDVLGKSNAVNFGIDRVKGDYLWIFDDDDAAFPDALERLVEPLEKDPKLGFSYGTCCKAEKGDSKTWKILGETRIPEMNGSSFIIELLKNNFLTGATVFARTNAYRSIGPFDPQLLRSQDYDVVIKLALNLKSARVKKGGLYYYRQYPGIRRIGKDELSAAETNAEWLHYDQLIFRGLHKTVPLSKYLIDENLTKENTREALLQRIRVMSIRLLIPEITSDLEQLSSTTETPITNREYSIIREIIFDNPYYGSGSIYDNTNFFKKISSLSKASQTMRLIRRKILYALLARFKSKPLLSQIPKIMTRVICLYL